MQYIHLLPFKNVFVFVFLDLLFASLNRQGPYKARLGSNGILSVAFITKNPKEVYNGDNIINSLEIHIPFGKVAGREVEVQIVHGHDAR